MKEEALIALQKGGPGASEKQITRTPEGIRIEVAIRIFTELISQSARSQRGYDLQAAVFAEKAFACADAFIKVWGNTL